MPLLVNSRVELDMCYFCARRRGLRMVRILTETGQVILFIVCSSAASARKMKSLSEVEKRMTKVDISKKVFSSIIIHLHNFKMVRTVYVYFHIYDQHQLVHNTKSPHNKLHKTPDMFRGDFTPSSGETYRTLKTRMV
jgi:sulfur relay (sulfurtransferase) complex TusBCD TusD component (DsrE family)